MEASVNRIINPDIKEISKISEISKNSENPKISENPEFTKIAQRAQNAQNSESTKITEATETTETAENTDNTENTKNTENTENIKTTENAKTEKSKTGKNPKHTLPEARENTDAMPPAGTVSSADNAAFGSFHPLSAFVYLLSVAILTMFSTDPVVLAISLVGSAAFCALISKPREILSDIGFYIPLFVLVSLTNPLFSHNGVTPLFFLNGNPVTLEAILYGIDIAAAAIASLLWFKCFSKIMTSDKILWLFGKTLPKTALVLSMALRFIPLFKRKWREIKNAQTAMGYYSERGIVAKVTGNMRIFSALVTWILENAAGTGASMRARGYGLRGRSHFSIFRFRACDLALLLTAAGLTGGFIAGTVLGVYRFSFYPSVTALDFSPISLIFYGVFAVLALLPAAVEIFRCLYWKLLVSRF